MSRSNSGNNDSSRNPSSDKRSLRQRMSRDLRLRGMAKRTHDGYLREVRKLACFYNTPPDQLTEQQVGEYLLHLINDCNFAPGTLGVAYSGIKFFYTFTEPRDWEVLRKLRRPKQKTLPSVLTIDEVHRLIGAVKQHRNAAYFWTIYSLGLRLEEGLNLMVYHPHVHFVVPGGGVSQDGSQWQAGPENFLLPEKAASIVYRAKFRDAMREAGLLDQIDPDVWKQTWVVDVEAVGDGRATLKYLAPYVYRAAISNNRIEDVDESSVTYRVTPSGSRESYSRPVSGNEFVRSFLQHTLPRNFQRLRYYGFASPNSKLQFAWVRMLVWFYLGWCYWLAKQAEPEPIEKTPVRCAGHRSPSGGLVGGGVMQLTEITDGSGRVLYSHPLPYLDSS